MMVLVKIVFRMLCFWCVLGGMVLALNYVTLNRSSEGCIQLADFYKLDEEEVDVLCIGSSHVYYGINTCQLYDDYGIASYLLASPGQPVWISYYLLEEALKTQKPRLVIFDIGTLFRKEEDFGSYSWETLISMKPSQTKWNAIQAVNQYEECLDAAGAFFSFPYYHTRFLSLTSEDFYRSKLIRYNGYRPEFTAISESELAKWKDKIWTPEKDGEAPAEQTSTFADGEEVLTERTEQYLRKMIQLCQDQGISLLLVNSPYANQVEEKRVAGNYIRVIADSYGVPLLEGNYLVDEMEIDFEKDLLDASHLNYFGSVKYTKYLAEWMQEHCQLPDRRGNVDYWEWEEVSDLFWEVKEEALAGELSASFCVQAQSYAG